MKVAIDIQTKLRNIKLTGRQNDVHKMSDLVAKELKLIYRRVAEAREESLIAKAIHWEYKDLDGSWLKFPDTVIKVREAIYEAPAVEVFGEIMLQSSQSRGYRGRNIDQSGSASYSEQNKFHTACSLIHHTRFKIYSAV